MTFYSGGRLLFFPVFFRQQAIRTIASFSIIWVFLTQLKSELFCFLKRLGSDAIRIKVILWISSLIFKEFFPSTVLIHHDRLQTCQKYVHTQNVCKAKYLTRTMIATARMNSSRMLNIWRAWTVLATINLVTRRALNKSKLLLVYSSFRQISLTRLTHHEVLICDTQYDRVMKGT